MWWLVIYTHKFIYINMHTHVWIYIYTGDRIHTPTYMHTHDSSWSSSSSSPSHMLDTARVCERMREIFTLSTASTDAPSSTSTRTVSAFPISLANSKAVLPSCEYSQVIRAERSIRLDEREHAQQYIHTCACMRIYTQPQTSPMCVYVKGKKNARKRERERQSPRFQLRKK